MKKQKNKITRSHSTSIEAALPFLALARKNKNVTKISLGIIKVTKSAPQKRIKCTLEKACIRIQVRGNRAIQEIRFFTTELLQLQAELETCAKVNGYEVSR